MKTPKTSRLFERRINEESGVEYYVLKERVCTYQQGFYFVNNSMTVDGHYLWFYATVNPVFAGVQRGRMLAYVDFLEDEVVICHDAPFDDASPYVDAESGEVYFTYGKGIYKRSPGKNNFAVKLCDVPIEGYVRQLATHLTRLSDKNCFFLDIQRDNFGSIQGVINVENGVFTEWARTEFVTNHGQINPKNDRLALCAYDYWRDLADGKQYVIPKDESGSYQRLWTVAADGTRKCYPPMHNHASHEFWSANGERFYYCSNPHGIYGVDLASGKDVVILENVDPWHAHASKDEKYFVYDQTSLARFGGKWFRGCPASVSFLNRESGKSIKIVSEMPENGHSPQNQNDYHIDPHPRFTENEKYVVFSTSELGGCDLAITFVDALIEKTK